MAKAGKQLSTEERVQRSLWHLRNASRLDRAATTVDEQAAAYLEAGMQLMARAGQGRRRAAKQRRMAERCAGRDFDTVVQKFHEPS